MISLFDRVETIVGVGENALKSLAQQKEIIVYRSMDFKHNLNFKVNFPVSSLEQIGAEIVILNTPTNGLDKHDVDCQI